MRLPPRPVIYEVHTFVWLDELKRRYQRELTLAEVPIDEWRTIAALGVDAIWLMGVWERSPSGLAIAAHNADLQASFLRALPDFTPEDNVGSAYCVRRYEVDARLGGRVGLATARAALASCGLGLILDFVPNHVAPDHPWVSEHPEYFIQGSAEELLAAPTSFIAAGEHVIACGKDPYFPAWPDVVQLNVFHPELRVAMITTVSDIASQCDGMRCDMAMLVNTNVFQRTWGERAGAPPVTEYWYDVIGSVKAIYRDVCFIAEVYWDMEWDLQQLGFDFCYDKRLYDRLEHESAANVRSHLLADGAYQEKLLRFIENHDESRAATAFPGARGRAAAVASMTLPGGKLIYHGQCAGYNIRPSVFLCRQPPETPDAESAVFYQDLLAALRLPALREGDWSLCQVTGWPDNPSNENLVAWWWRHATQQVLIVVNLSDSAAQGLLMLPWPELANSTVQLNDVLGDTHYERDGSLLVHEGLYVALAAWGYHVFVMTP
jgi:glycosidase